VVAARHNGVLTRALPRNGVQISPPFVVTEAQIVTIAHSLGTAIDQAAAAE
jgi:adenosylmethionine-8-amino-7-oxononanoate aminotransferase